MISDTEIEDLESTPSYHAGLETSIFRRLTMLEQIREDQDLETDDEAIEFLQRYDIEVPEEDIDKALADRVNFYFKPKYRVGRFGDGSHGVFYTRPVSQ